MNIDTEFNIGDSVCYLNGDNIIHSTISKIIIEILMIVFLWFISCLMDLVYPETIIPNGIKDFLGTKRV